MNPFDVFQDVESQAYEAHRRSYEQQNPPPQFHFQPVQSILTMITLALISIAAMAVSAGHSIPAVIDTYIELPWYFLYPISICALLMIEGVLVGVSHILVEMLFRTKKDPRPIMIFILKSVLMLVLFLAIVLNVFSSLKGYEHNIPNFDIFVALYVGVSAPIVASLTGGLLSIIYVNDSFDNKRLKNEHAEQMTMWHKDLNEAWKNNRKNFQINKVVQQKLENSPMMLVTKSNLESPNFGLLENQSNAKLDISGYSNGDVQGLIVPEYEVENKSPIGFSGTSPRKVQVKKSKISPTVQDGTYFCPHCKWSGKRSSWFTHKKEHIDVS